MNIKKGISIVIHIIVGKAHKYRVRVWGLYVQKLF